MQEQRRDLLWRAITEQTGSPGQAIWAESVCHTCVEQLAGVDAAAMTLRASPRAQDMLGASSEWAGHLEQQQYTLGEGPGVRAFTDGSPALVSDLSHDEGRWPGFADAAQSIGAAAVFAFPLRIGGIRLGTLTLYRRQPGALSPSALADAALLVDLITFALLEQAEFSKNAGEEWIRTVGSYQDVNIATGVLSAKLAISLDDALLRLRAHAFQQGRPILELAREILGQRIDVGEFNE
ncbi:GAF and ANTAR domain-containing protein [Rhodococcoides kyotonense]|uniref:ANTAR domain-containing protein n=1 Tax=Rhodococcoides kyotonense TaxID=398843 RepID=A0A239MJW9_9NOCA|nr:GAF and ANTAR domain-containing protein [Rhodococcus kyotonensis]SNT42372.1 ANTAR domain-containing protein [Rhodococcus kyotonensis]